MKNYFSYFLFGVLCFVQLSCKNKSSDVKHTIDTVYVIDSMFKDIDFVKLPSNVMVWRHNIEKVDTVIQGYSILFLLKDDGSFIFVEKNKYKAVIALEREVILKIENKPIGMNVNKIIQKSDFSEYIPKEELKKYILQSFWIKVANSQGVVLYINFCLPDTDICYMFELHFNNKGEMKIIPIDEGPMGED